MGQKYSPNLLADIRSAFKEAEPPETIDELTGRTIVEEMFDDITDLRDNGHTFESISEVLKGVGVTLEAKTLSAYYRGENKARKSRERKARKLARMNETEGQATGQDASINTSQIDTIGATLVDETDDDIQ